MEGGGGGGGGGGKKNASVFSGFGQTDVFDPSAPPPFKIAEIRAAIPKHCWIKSSWRSLSYVLRDLLVIFALAAAAIYFNAGIFWPFYWVAQGTMFWAIFVLGHDCGHGSFSDNSLLNSLVGHILHSAILVPYHGWRISHRTHHQNHGNVENDESWVPLTEKLYKSLDYSTKMLRFTVPFPLLAYPFYLWTRGPGKEGSHFNPNSKLFAPNDRNDVITSTVCWSIMVALLISLSFAIGPIQMLKLYCVPHLIFVMWLDFVTYLHHHGYEQKLPWYRGKEWSYLRGGLTTVDRDYGWINNIHHDIGTHVIHHLFPQIPHYHLVEAIKSCTILAVWRVYFRLQISFFVSKSPQKITLTSKLWLHSDIRAISAGLNTSTILQTEAAKPVLGKYYREPKKSGPIPFHLIQNLARSIKEDHYVSDSGEIVYYQTDSELYKSSRDKSN